MRHIDQKPTKINRPLVTNYVGGNGKSRTS